MKHYDYIFAGAGLASLMTVYKISQNNKFNGRKILLIDADSKKANNRTWCFWGDGAGLFENIVHRSWDTATFINKDGKDIDLDFGRRQYYMIRGIDFYNFVFKEFEKFPNIEFIKEKVTAFKDDGSQVTVTTDSETYTCHKLLNSIYNPTLPASQSKYPVLQQHFIGWHVKTKHDVFNENKPMFMDFSIPQRGNTRFMYVLPFAPNEALIEYTLFSKNLLPEAEYEDAIKDYLEQQGAGSYEIIDKERGSIPMTCYPFWERDTKNVTHIGSAGGWTKASTGYTFRNADKLSTVLAEQLLDNTGNISLRKKDKFWHYDLLLLDILAQHNEKGSEIFSALFKDGEADTIFSFLDEETTFAEDLTVILKCPKGVFINAALRRLLNLQPKK